MIGFVAAVLVVLGVWFLFSRGEGPSWCWALDSSPFSGLMMVLRGKFYYVAPVYPVIYAAGAVCLEQLTERKRWRWVRPAYAVVLAGCGRSDCPNHHPRPSGETFIAYSTRLGITQQKFENQPLGDLPQILPTCMDGKTGSGSWRTIFTRSRPRNRK